MLIYGDASRRENPADVLARVRQSLGSAARLEPGIRRHSQLIAALIEGGELAQGLADACFQASGQRDIASPMHEAAMSLVRALAASCALSWGSDFAWYGTPPEAELEACAAELPQDAIEIKTPEGYAHYALYPESYLESAFRLRARSWQVFGLRSIGTSLSAMVAAQLGAPTPVTLRPVGHPFERALAADSAQIDRRASAFAIVDEGPGVSGSSMAAVARWLVEAGVSGERLHFFASHANGPGAKASAQTQSLWALAHVHAADFDQTVLHTPRSAHRLGSWLEKWLGPLHAPLQDIAGGRWRDLQDWEAGDEPPVNTLRERRKFLATSSSGRWLIKFVGLGREGERKFARARQLAAAGLSPQPAGLCHGFMIERWRDDMRPLPSHLTGELRSRVVDGIGHYLGFRGCAFRANPSAGASLQQLWEMGRLNTGEILGADAAAAWDSWQPLLGRLQTMLQRVETDNRMHPWEWLTGAGQMLLKTDAVDHHAGHDLIGCQDLAWDIAGAAVEFQLSAAEVRRVIELSGKPVEGHLLELMRRCYLAFEAARYREAVAAGACGSNARVTALAFERCQDALAIALTRE